MRSRKITDFTLFWSDSTFEGRKPGYQMNVRRQGEPGWDCSRITEEQAQTILSMLETIGHPDGPWTVRIQASKYRGNWNDTIAAWKVAAADNTEAKK